MTMRKYNRVPDKQDARDFKYAAHLMTATKLPSHADLRPYCPPVVDQGDIGSCTGNAIAGALEYMQLREQRYKVGGPQVFDRQQFYHFSRLFIYYNERLLENTISEDAGAEIRDGIKVIAQWGACRESVWGYSHAHLFAKPTLSAYNEAAQHKAKTYYRINSLNEMKHCLADGYPFVFGFTVYDGFESEETASTGVLHMPTANENIQGGHAVMAVGYDDAKKVVIVRNSWGTSWGMSGYFTMPYAYISNPELASDFWTVRK
jgi:C1A family cysteine protease